ncbi:MAG TPA: chemotaxis protein [Clostridiaceae bacterium]|nr:chemotaxis protein [Clostridiaceae bacterium]
MSNKRILITVAICYILGFVIFLMPFPAKLINTIIYLPVCLAAAACLVRSSSKTNAQKDVTINDLKRELAKLKLELHVTSNKIWAVSEQLQINLDENNGFAQQVYAQAEEMADLNTMLNEKMHETVMEVREMIRLLEESRSTTLELESLGKNSETILETSKSEILEIASIIREIEATFRITADYMDKLSDASKDIVRILETVNHIARQTRLLSLNATIESARAGENGKGFAVVAREVQKLATESENSVKEVKHLISAINEEISGVYRTVSENGIKVEKGVKSAINIENKLARIHESFHGVLDMAQKIIFLSETEARGASNVVNKICEVENLTGVAEKSVESVKAAVYKQMQGIMEVAEMGSRLNDASKGLMELQDNSGLDNLISENSEYSNKINDAFKLIRELAALPQIKKMDKESHRKKLTGLIQNNDFIEAAWSNDAKGRFLCSIPEAGIANAKIRDWFQKSIQGEEFCSKVYISAITKSPCLTLSVPITDEDGVIAGVLGIDLKL